MKCGLPVIFAVIVALGASWIGLVIAPALQLGTLKETTVLNTTDVYPPQRTGAATLGLQAYRANGCAACHTEQVRQDGVTCEVVLTDAGKNPSAVTNLLTALTLTTFRDVAWNAPFYQRLGFAVLPREAISPYLAGHLRDEIERGLPADRRCAMRLGLG